MAEINVVPYIDVTLVLLIIFMITAPLLQTGVEVELPEANAETVDIDSEQSPIIVSIDKEGQFYVDIGEQDATPLELEELLDKVAQAQERAVAEQHPKPPVFIRGDRAVDYGKVVEVMAALKQSGVTSVGLMTETTE